LLLNRYLKIDRKNDTEILFNLFLMLLVQEIGIKYQPSKGKTGGLGWSENMQHVAVGCQDGEADILEDRVRRAQLQEQHDEDSMVRDLNKK
jgi:hypothetical protein